MLIEDRKPKGRIEKSGYGRLLPLGDPGMKRAASLTQKCHSTVIGNGNELEDLIYERSSHPNKDYNRADHDHRGGTFEDRCKIIPKSKFDLGAENAFIVKFKLERGDKNEKKGSKRKKIECDAILLERNKIILFEIKDGHQFDTKKSEGEYTKLCEAARLVEEQDPLKRKCDFKFVSWNVNNVSEISLKHKAADAHLMRGRDFAQLIGIDYEKLNTKRDEDQKGNGEYILNEMENILREAGRRT
mgnify:CR=1 FL=1